LPALIEIDADGHRSGVLPSDRQRLVAIGQALHRGGAELRGVLTHAGGSYALHRPEDIAAAAAAGSGLDQVLKVTAYIAGVEHWPAFNRIYAEVFAEARPARSVVPVPALHHGYLVEIEAIAVRPAER
jgi:hypothetical protein